MHIYPPPPQAIPALTNALLNDDEPSIRIKSAEILGNFGKEVTPFLERALNDKHPSVRDQSANAMEKITGKSFEEFKQKGVINMNNNQIQFHFQMYKSDPPLFIALFMFLIAFSLSIFLTSLSNIRGIPLIVGWFVVTAIIVSLFFKAYSIIYRHYKVDQILNIIERLDNKESDVRYRVVETLMNITGESYGEDKEKWLKWLKKQRIL